MPENAEPAEESQENETAENPDLLKLLTVKGSLLRGVLSLDNPQLALVDQPETVATDKIFEGFKAKAKEMANGEPLMEMILLLHLFHTEGAVAPGHVEHTKGQKTMFYEIADEGQIVTELGYSDGKLLMCNYPMDVRNPASLIEPIDQVPDWLAHPLVHGRAEAGLGFDGPEVEAYLKELNGDHIDFGDSEENAA